MKKTSSAPYPPPDPEAKPSRKYVEEARFEFMNGVEAFQIGAFAEAVRAFERAYALVPNARVLRNIGMALLESGDTEKACATLELYALYEPNARRDDLPTSQCPNLEALPAP